MPFPILASAILITQVSKSEYLVLMQNGEFVRPEVKLSKCLSIMLKSVSSLGIGQLLMWSCGQSARFK